MKKFAALFVLIVAAFALVACGGGDDTTSDATTETPTTQEESGGGGEKEAEGGTAGSPTLDVEADPSGALAYTTDEASAKAGSVTVNFTNSSPVPHDVALEDESGQEVGKTEVLAEGSASTKVTLKPGEYKFFCTVPGHRQGGMEGTLTVE